MLVPDPRLMYTGLDDLQSELYRTRANLRQRLRGS